MQVERRQFTALGIDHDSSNTLNIPTRTVIAALFTFVKLWGLDAAKMRNKDSLPPMRLALASTVCHAPHKPSSRPVLFAPGADDLHT